MVMHTRFSKSQAFVALPLIGGGRCLAALDLAFDKPTYFSEAAKEQMTAVASLCAHALDRAFLFDRIRHRANALEVALRAHDAARLQSQMG